MPKLVVDRGKVEAHLAGELRFEFLDLEIDDDETAQPLMIE